MRAMASKKVTLISSDLQELEVLESTAVQAAMIRNMVDDGYADNPIPLPNVDSKTLSEVIEYLNSKSLSAKEKTNFDKAFFSKTFDELMDCVLAANYLAIADLVRIGIHQIAEFIEHKSVEEVRKLFAVENDFTADEEAAIWEKHAWAFQDT